MYHAQNQLLRSQESVTILKVKLLLPCIFSVLTFDYDIMEEEVEMNFETFAYQGSFSTLQGTAKSTCLVLF